MRLILNAQFCRVRMGQLALLCIVLLGTSRVAFASNYSCGNPQTGHCYAYVNWQEHPQYFGSYVDILQNFMNCPSNCGGFLNNEMWLADTQTPACVNNPLQSCWVEAGYHAFAGEGNPYYFWADSRPMNSNTYNNHYLSQADLVDFEHFMIIQDARGPAGVYQVWIYNDSGSTFFNGASTSNTMSANVIDVGTELAGSTGASDAFSWFQRNIWAVKPLGQDYTFWYNRQVDEGGVTSQSPPTGLWLINPNLPPPPEGGLFQTNCCG